MRILLVNDYAGPLGGAEASQLVLRDSLARRGHDVRIFASTAGRTGAETPPEAHYQCFGTTSRFRTLLQMFNPWAATALRRALNEFRPDVVHVRVFLTQLSPSILPALRRVPSLHHITWYRFACPTGTKILPDGSPCREPAGLTCCRHGCIPWRDAPPLLIQIRLQRRWIGAFRAHIANSEDARRLATAEGLQPVEVLWNGVPKVPQRPPLPADPTVLYAGQLVHQKGVDLLLRAFARVIPRLPNARLFIAGDGVERGRLTALLGEFQLASRVTMLGHLDRAALERHAAAAWVQVVPTRWSESFANVAAEAMMRGTAVIASRLGAMAEYIRDRETGILVDSGVEDQLARALETILSDRDLAERMGARARQVALGELDADAWAEKFEAVYRRLQTGAA